MVRTDADDRAKFAKADECAQEFGRLAVSRAQCCRRKLGNGTMDPVIRHYQRPIAVERSARWGGIEAELIRREPHDGSQDRFLLNSYAFAMTFFGHRLPGSVTRFGGGKPVQHRRTGPGNVFLLPAGVDDATEHRGATQVEFLVLMVPSEAWAELVADGSAPATARLLPTICLESSVCRSLMTQFRTALATGQALGRLYAEAAVTILLSEALRHSSTHTVKPSARSQGGLAPGQLKRVTGYIRDHLDKDLSLTELAGIVGQSSRHFGRAFRQSTGLPPHRWQVQQRIERTRALLLDTDMPIGEIAVLVGFTDQSHLTTVFRRIVGATPGAWRRLVRN